MLEIEMTKSSEYLHSNSNRRFLLVSPVIRNYPEDGSIFVKECHTWQDCCDGWTELNTDNDEIGPRSRPYKPEAFEPSGPGCCFFWAGYQKICLFFSLFCSASIPSAEKQRWEISTAGGNFFAEWGLTIHKWKMGKDVYRLWHTVITWVRGSKRAWLLVSKLIFLLEAHLFDFARHHREQMGFEMNERQ